MTRARLTPRCRASWALLWTSAESSIDWYCSAGFIGSYRVLFGSHLGARMTYVSNKLKRPINQIIKEAVVAFTTTMIAEVDSHSGKDEETRNTDS